MYSKINIVIFIRNVRYHFCNISLDISMLLLMFLETKKLHQSGSLMLKFSTFADIFVSSSVSKKLTCFSPSFIFISFHLSFPFLCLLTAIAQTSLSFIVGIPISSVISKIPNLFSSHNIFFVITFLHASTAPMFLPFSLIFITPKYTTLSLSFEEEEVEDCIINNILRFPLFSPCINYLNFGISQALFQYYQFYCFF